MADLRYSAAHVWTRLESEEAVLGLTDYLQDQLGDIVALELPDFGDVIRAGRRMGRVESDEATSPLESPVSGEVVEVNGEVLESPDLVNADPYEAGWLLRVRLDDPSELEDLMTEEEYAELTTEL
jgi:glycine cleavage system H protein